MISAHHELWQKIQAHGFDDRDAALPFSRRLACDNRWNEGYARRVIEEYRRFALLAATARHPVTPSDAVDQVWHLHLLYSADYWERFCGNVLGVPLHHGPTRGGPAESEKFRDWYERTLSSYRELFGEEAPADIWPGAEQRFGADLKFERVNVQRYWLIPKPNLRLCRPGSRLAVALALACGTAGCTAAAAPLSPSARVALTAFVVLWMGTLALGLVLKRSNGRAVRPPAETAPELDVCEMAVLAGGTQRAADVVLVNLYRYGAVTCHRAKFWCLDAPPASAHALEHGLWEGLRCWPSGLPLARVRLLLAGSLAELERRLEALDLIVTRRRTLLCLGAALIAPALGIGRIVSGVTRDRPVGLLVLLCGVAIATACVLFTRTPLRTVRGQRLLAAAQSRHVALRKGWHREDTAQAPLPGLAVALFGATILDGTPLAELSQTLRRRPESAVVDGGGGDAAGGCGGSGGCGGCGGCGG